MTFGEKLVKLRKQNALSQEQLAEKLNVSRQAVSRWELGASSDVDNVVKIGRFFDCSLDYLLNNEITDEDIAAHGKTIPNSDSGSTTKNTKTKFVISYVLSVSAIVIGGILALLIPLFAKTYQAFEFRNYHSSFTYASDYISRFPILGVVLISAMLIIVGVISLWLLIKYEIR